MYSLILERELNWVSFASKLRHIRDKNFLNQMFKSANKYAGAIEAKRGNYSTQFLLMSLLLNQHKKLLNFSE
jgi:hypothetical protein